IGTPVFYAFGQGPGDVNVKFLSFTVGAASGAGYFVFVAIGTYVAVAFCSCKLFVALKGDSAFGVNNLAAFNLQGSRFCTGAGSDQFAQNFGHYCAISNVVRLIGREVSRNYTADFGIGLGGRDIYFSCTEFSVGTKQSVNRSTGIIRPKVDSEFNAVSVGER